MVTTPAKDLDETLATIARQAKALRDAGVTGRVSVGLISFELERAEPPPAPPVQAEQAPAESSDPLDDGATYGGHVPRRRVRSMPIAEPNEE